MVPLSSLFIIYIYINIFIISIIINSFFKLINKYTNITKTKKNLNTHEI